MENIPICVDLDGTLIYEDVTQISIRKFIKKYPARALAIPYWFLFGRGHLKARLAEYVSIDPKQLTYHQELVEFLKKQSVPLYLATACNIKIAEAVAAHLGLFTGVIASDSKTNKRAAEKAKALNNKFGKGNYAYAGNSYDDLKVWQDAAKKIVVNPSSRLLPHLNFKIDHYFK